jgi:hypothetical protein
MINPRDFRMLREDVNLNSHIIANPFTVGQSSAWKYYQKRRQQLLQKDPLSSYFPWNETPGPRHSSHEHKVNKNHFLAIMAP